MFTALTNGINGAPLDRVKNIAQSANTFYGSLSWLELS